MKTADAKSAAAIALVIWGSCIVLFLLLQLIDELETSLLRNILRSILLLASGAVASFAVIRWHRRVLNTARFAAGLCPACGYDLRSSKDRCPECGLAIMPQKRGEP